MTIYIYIYFENFTFWKEKNIIKNSIDFVNLIDFKYLIEMKRWFEHKETKKEDTIKFSFSSYIFIYFFHLDTNLRVTNILGDSILKYWYDKFSSNPFIICEIFKLFEKKYWSEYLLTTNISCSTLKDGFFQRDARGLWITLDKNESWNTPE